MTREIKFRAWVENRGFTNELPMLRSTQDRKGREIVQTESVTIEQFTGLKDKNGKEIYEGDIINVWDWGRPPNSLLGKAAIVWDETEKGWNLSPEFNIDRYDLFRNAEVIGNVHENPELLKV